MTLPRVHFVDEGPKNGPVVLCLHGEPAWSFLYRKMVPPLVAAGYRVVVPDFIGLERILKGGKKTYKKLMRKPVEDW